MSSLKEDEIIHLLQLEINSQTTQTNLEYIFFLIYDHINKQNFKNEVDFLTT